MAAGADIFHEACSFADRVHPMPKHAAPIHWPFQKRPLVTERIGVYQEKELMTTSPADVFSVFLTVGEVLEPVSA
jgi:hypothetical protein